MPREIEKLTDAIAQMGPLTALVEQLRKAEAECDGPKLAPRRAAAAPLPSAIQAQVHALVTGREVALRKMWLATRAVLPMSN